MRRASTIRRRSTGALVALAVAFPLALAAPSAAAPIDEARARARAVADRVEQLQERASILDEDYNAARLEAEQAEAEVAATTAAVARTEAEVATLRGRVQEQAVAAYLRGGVRSGFDALLGSPGTDLVAVRTYLGHVVADEHDSIDALRTAQADLERQAADLGRAAEEARAARAEVDAARQATEAAVTEQERELREVQGEVARLVAEEQARREAEARAQAEARRRAAEAAAAAQRAAAAQQAAAATRAAPAPAPTAASRPATPAAPAAPTRPAAAREVAVAAPAASPPRSSGGNAVVAAAQAELGKPYRWGGAGPGSYDCSGLTLTAWKAAGVSLAHSSRAQFSSTARVSRDQLQPGDLVFFGSPIHHVGVYVGDGQMIDAPHSGAVVRYASIDRRDVAGYGRPG